MRVFQEIRALREAAEKAAYTAGKLTGAVLTLVELHKLNGPSEARLEDLERTRAHWEAEMEAMVLKADSTHRSAQNAESRARTMQKNYEKHFDPFDPDSVEDEDERGRGTRAVNGESGEEEGLLPLPMDLERNPKAYAVRAKWGI